AGGRVLDALEARLGLDAELLRQLLGGRFLVGARPVVRRGRRDDALGVVPDLVDVPAAAAEVLRRPVRQALDRRVVEHPDRHPLVGRLLVTTRLAWGGRRRPAGRGRGRPRRRRRGARRG